ncbi:MAG: UDP-glucose/GDP-mannose dehydrogenase family protein [Magnetococcales bacterium]|nr:UDP-glucose/GDP-mannose dehydrogenase family protein [Magnetococcales bacterium]MBF0149839.1 UDP-glucose/GDP-mannose dehydrogenase family protein [Magnetococcales bacterium]
MKTSIFGMGYVGCVSAACLASEHHHVIGVDVSQQKINLLREGRSPVEEEQLPEMIRKAINNGHLSATTDPREAILATDLSLIAVGTPSREDGSLELCYLKSVARDIALALKEKTDPHFVVIRSTVPPGTTEHILTPLLLEGSGRTLDHDLFVCYNPEFLREGSSIKDFFNPPFTIIGARDQHTFQRVSQLYQGVKGAIVRCSIQAAESMKTLCNVFHALKITFANEAASVLHGCGTDAMEAMELFLKDDKLNISRAYLRPGFAFGGSCLPKDVNALAALGRAHGIDTPLLSSINASNHAHLLRAISLVERQQEKKITLLGISFKPGTDDLRESPALRLAAHLARNGYDLRIYDPIVCMYNLLGANLHHMQRIMPDLERYLDYDLDRVLDHGTLWVIAHVTPQVKKHLLDRARKSPVIDLSGILSPDAAMFAYQGLCWKTPS